MSIEKSCANHSQLVYQLFLWNQDKKQWCMDSTDSLVCMIYI